MEGSFLKKNYLMKIRSKYILKQILDNTKFKKMMEIIKYNGNIQDKLNIDLYDYKKYYETIEIVIIPKNNKDKNIFINIPSKYESYFHIFFNDDIIETKNHFFTKNENVNKIRIKVDMEIKSFSELFKECDCIEKIKFIKFKRDDITDMSYMFSGCSSLKDLRLDSFNSNNVTNMDGMFEKCSSLKELNLKNLNTLNVTSMQWMFFNCLSLKELNLDNFYTENVFNMNNMFHGCSSLKQINFGKFNTSNVNNMSNMFNGC